MGFALEAHPADKLEAARTGNYFLEQNLVIARLDKLSRNADVQEKLAVPDARWDLIVCDEAHKMSATFFSGGASRRSLLPWAQSVRDKIGR